MSAWKTTDPTGTRTLQFGYPSGLQITVYPVTRDADENPLTWTFRIAWRDAAIYGWRTWKTYRTAQQHAESAAWSRAIWEALLFR